MNVSERDRGILTGRPVYGARSGRLRRGVMLLETTVAMFTLLMGVLTFAGMAVFAQKVGLQAQIRTAAYQVANQQIETLRTSSFENLQLVGETPFVVPSSLIESLPGRTNSKYEVGGSYRVESMSSTVKKVSVRVRWRNASTPEGQSAPWSEVRLATLVARPGSVTAGPIVD